MVNRIGEKPKNEIKDLMETILGTEESKETVDHAESQAEQLPLLASPWRMSEVSRVS